MTNYVHTLSDHLTLSTINVSYSYMVVQICQIIPILVYTSN